MITPPATYRRFLAGFEMIPFHPCWEWLGPKDKDGYGYFWVGKTTRAHRYSMSLKEEIKPGLVVDHICRNRACVRPEHLRQVTPRENVLFNTSGLAAKNKAKAHCWRGHEFDDKNTYIDTRGDRGCRKCSAIKTMKHYYKTRPRGN